jgi:uncharacterized protein YxeA|tara:strand:+ start:1378 stop:1554 length:177 start_codon:yes stop_codon:yes gene_type:complete
MKKIIITITALLFLAGCANKQIVFGKRCFDKSTGTHSWSYVWVADQEVIDQKLLRKCK